ncbi:MAG: response regulator [Pseudobdellovibrionaceae bacterium]
MTKTEEPKKHILIVEDDEAFRNLLGQILETEGFVVRYAENGLIAKTILNLNSNAFEIVLSDVRMPEMDGATLLRTVRAEHPKTKFIVMTGFSEILEAKHAFELGADEFLPKPFKMKELLESVERVLNPKEETSAATSTEEDEFSFCKIHVDEFTSASMLPSDIYIRLTDNKFIKVAREGAEIHLQRIQTYKEKKVEYFYVHVKDFQKYAGFTLRLARAVLNSKKITREQKIKLYKHTSEILLNQIFIEDLRPQDMEFSQNIISSTLNVIGDEPEIFDLVLLLKSNSDAVYAQSVAVSVLSCLVAKKMNWSSQQTLMKLSLGGIFHDIGKKELSPALLSKNRREMTPAEIALYESHPQRGKDLLGSMPGFPSDVIQIAFQHHENCIGTGYPLGLSGARVHPLAKLIHLVDEFFHSCQKYKGENAKPWKPALSELWEMKGSELDPHHLKALMEIFDYPLPTPLIRLKAAS